MQNYYKGVIYFQNKSDAQKIVDSVSGIVRDYTRGYAVQYWVSGPYYPEHTCRPARARSNRQ